MLMSVEQDRLVRMIKESISLMCKSSLTYDLELNVEGLLGITLDKRDVVLVNINESFQTEKAHSPPAKKSAEEPAETAESDNVIEIKGEEESPPSCVRKRRARRRSHEMPAQAGSGQHVSADFELPEFSAHSQTTPQQSTDYDALPPSRKSGRFEHPNSSRDTHSLNISSRQDSGGDLNFGEIVIKEEVGDSANNESIEDFSFTGETFPGDHPPYPTSLPLPGSSDGASHIPGSYPIASTSATDESQSGTEPRGQEEVVDESIDNKLQRSRIAGGQHAVYPCRFCGRVLMSLVGRQQHERLHTGRGFTCSFCGKSFTTNSARQRHISGVHEKRRFACTSCSRTFCQLGHLNVHRTKCHPDDIPANPLKDAGAEELSSGQSVATGIVK